MSKIMTDEELLEFLERIKDPVLFEEINDINRLNGFSSASGYPRYLSGVRKSLLALGYDRKWIYHSFSDILDHLFLKVPLNEKIHSKFIIENLVKLEGF